MKLRQFTAIFMTLIFLSACTGKSATGPKGPGRIETPAPGPRNVGGVDVGNLRATIVPETNASMSYPGQWGGKVNDGRLEITNASGSSVTARKSEIVDLNSPTAMSLEKYLNEKYPERRYKRISINGLEGVRADLVNTATEKQSDIFVLSELKDFVHIESTLKSADKGIEEGEQIISTVRVAYRGLPAPANAPRTAKLEARGTGPDRHAYSFTKDCYFYSDSGCNPDGGVAVAYEGEFQIGTAGYDTGRVVELGPETQIPFDSIRVDGDYLVAPLSNIPITDIYTAFQPKTPAKDQDRIQLKEGYVYLVRTVSWPDEDVITKMRVDKLDERKSVEITYQRLVYVEPAELAKQVEAIKAFTEKYEKPQERGDVTLYSRGAWGNYFYASFNFEFSTTGQPYSSGNGWDLIFDQGGFRVPHSAGSLGEVVDVGTVALDSISPANYPDPNVASTSGSVPAVVGHTYLIWHFDYSGQATYGAVKVLELGPDSSWVRLQFRRVSIQPVTHFQKWTALTVPADIQIVELIDEQTERARYYPFIMKRGDVSYQDNEMIQLGTYGSKPSLGIDSRPFGKDRGFVKLSGKTDLMKVTAAQVEGHRGSFADRYVTIKAGDVYAALLENFHEKTILVFKVQATKPGKSTTLAIRYISREKAPYSEAKE